MHALCIHKCVCACICTCVYIHAAICVYRRCKMRHVYRNHSGLSGQGLNNPFGQNGCGQSHYNAATDTTVRTAKFGNCDRGLKVPQWRNEATTEC